MPEEDETTKIKDYKEQICKEQPVQDEIEKTLSISERVAMDRLKMLKVGGKRGRGAPVFLTENMKESVDIIVDYHEIYVTIMLMFLSDDSLLKDIISQLQTGINPNLQHNTNVWREAIWEGAMLGFGQVQFNAQAPINVVFENLALIKLIAEGAVDQGSPRMESFTLVQEAMQNPAKCGCFIGDAGL